MRRLISRGDTAAVVGLVALEAVQLGPLAGAGRLPQNLDLMLQYVPNAAYLARGLISGHVPLWNPYQGAGMPFAADPGTAAWYLPSWPLLALLPLEAAVRALLWLHLLGAATGTYAYLRVVPGVRPSGAWIGAAAFALTTWLPGLAGMPVVLSTVAWLPWIALLGYLAVCRGWGWTAALGVAGALQLAAGWPAGAYLTWAAVGGLAVMSVPPRRWARIAAAAAVAALLAGVLLVPAVELIGQTNYGETRPVERVAHEGYLTLLSWLRPAGGTGSLESSQLYVGAGSLVLALAGALRGRRPWAWRYLAVAFMALVVALGTHGPLFTALYRWLPGFRIVYLPARLGVVAAFALACLAALGAERIAFGTWRKRDAVWLASVTALAPLVVLLQFWQAEGYDSFRRLLTNLGRFAGGPYLTREQEALYVAGVVAVLVLATLATQARMPRSGLAAALVCATAVDVLLAQRQAAPPSFAPDAWYAPALRTADAVKALAGDARFTGLQWHGDQHFLNDFLSSARPELLPPNLATLAGVRDAAAYNPLLLRRSVRYYAPLVAGERDDHWLWLDAFHQPGVADLAVTGVLTSGSEWRVNGVQVGTPVELPAGGAWQVVWQGGPLAVGRARVVTYLGESTSVAQGTPAIQIAFAVPGSSDLTADLRAGVETAEWAYGRPDVRAAAQHRQAPVALETSLQGAVGGRFRVYQYLATVPLPSGGQVSGIRARSLVPGAHAYVQGVWLEPDTASPAVPLGEEVSLLSLPQAEPRVRLSGGKVELLVDAPERLRVRTTSSRAGTLTVADAYYPGWHASMGGTDLEIRPHDGLFRDVSVPAGTHEVAMEYRPASLLWGALASATGVALSLGLVLAARYRLGGR